MAVTAAIIAGVLGAAGSIGAAAISGSKEGGDDLRKLQKKALQPDPIDEVMKQARAALIEKALVDSLINSQQDRLLMEDKLRLAGFEPEIRQIPVLTGPSVIRRSEKGPDKFIPVPGGQAIFDPSTLTPAEAENIDILGPILAAFRPKVLDVSATSKGGDIRDKIATTMLSQGKLNPVIGQSPIETLGGARIGFQREGTDPQFFIPEEITSKFNNVPGTIYIRRGTPGADELINLARQSQFEALIQKLISLGII